MPKLEDVEIDRLHQELARDDTATNAKRLMVALAYKDGVGVKVIGNGYRISQSTIDYWLPRFEDQSIEEAIEDETGRGRPPKLTKGTACGR